MRRKEMWSVSVMPSSSRLLHDTSQHTTMTSIDYLALTGVMNSYIYTHTDGGHSVNTFR